MTDPKLKEKLKSQTDDLYRAYGRFAVQFEHICHNTHNAITFLLHKEGLKNQQVANIMLAGITADPIRVLFASLVGELKALDAAEKKIFDSVMTRFQLLTEQRNNVIHSTWFVGWANEQQVDFSNVTGFKHDKNKKGAAVKAFDFSAADFDSLADEAENLSKIIFSISACFITGKSIKANLLVSANGHVSVPQ